MKDTILGLFSAVLMLLMLCLAIGACVIACLLYSRGFDEQTKTVIIVWFVVGFAWWVIASVYRTLRRKWRI